MINISTINPRHLLSLFTFYRFDLVILDDLRELERNPPGEIEHAFLLANIGTQYSDFLAELNSLIVELYEGPYLRVFREK